MSLNSPFRPPERESIGKRFLRGLTFYSVVFLIIVVWAASSLVIAPVVQWGIDRVGDWTETSIALRHEATMGETALSIPCSVFENVPPGCDGLATSGPIRYGASSVLYFWGRMPGLDGLTADERQIGVVPTSDTNGVFYTVQKSFGRLPTGDEALALARSEMASYGGYTERQLAPDVLAVEAAEGSATRAGNFYAVYTRSDGLKVAASCFGTTCKVLQAPWRADLAYGVTINVRNAAELPAIDAAVRTRIDGFLKTP